MRPAAGGTRLSMSLQPADLSVEKVAFSAFYMSRLEWVLRKAGIETLVFSGIVTNGGVASTLRDAHVRDFHTVLLEDGCAAFSEDVHRTNVDALRSVAEIMTCADFVAALQAAADERRARQLLLRAGRGAHARDRRRRLRACRCADGEADRHRGAGARAGCHAGRLDRAVVRSDPGRRHALSGGQGRERQRRASGLRHSSQEPRGERTRRSRALSRRCRPMPFTILPIGTA